MARDTRRRNGKPRTETERNTRHKRLYGNKSPLPPKGTGRNRRKAV